ncbi:translation initiation factor IF-2-like [Myotis myotis]|uniref:translation initiation factor IF-2-like n=1 Tax=Myotis myotis TaxID=51298 RepID=UPI0017497162|nr:translation initiation factor IF-2-like [Myotis myotis]
MVKCGIFHRNSLLESSLTIGYSQRKAKWCCQAPAVKHRWSFPGSSLATQKAARRPPTGAIPALRPGQRGWGKGEPEPTSTSACPSQSPSRAPARPRPSPSSFPSPQPRRGLGRKLRALRGSADSDLGGGGARPRLSLETAASLAPGKFFKVPSSACPGRLRWASRRRPARQPRRRLCRYRRQQRALDGSLPRGKRAGSRRAGPPPGAKAAADAGGLEGGSRPAPTARAAPRRLHLGSRRAGRGARPKAPEGAVRAKGPGRPRATDTSKFFPAPSPHPRQTQGSPGAGGSVLGSPTSTPSSVSLDPHPPGKFLPVLPLPSNPKGKGRDSDGHAPHEY